jgi:hypothetical protein
MTTFMVSYAELSEPIVPSTIASVWPGGGTMSVREDGGDKRPSEK